MSYRTEIKEHYSLLEINDFKAFRKTPDPENALRDILAEKKKPVIVLFNDDISAGDHFFQWIDNMSAVFYENALPWVLIPPFSDYNALEEKGIQFAPTFQEAVDMAFMLKLEQDFMDEEDDDSS